MSLPVAAKTHHRTPATGDRVYRAIKAGRTCYGRFLEIYFFAQTPGAMTLARLALGSPDEARLLHEGPR
jgi:hypothetical protein